MQTWAILAIVLVFVVIIWLMVVSQMKCVVSGCGGWVKRVDGWSPHGEEHFECRKCGHRTFSRDT
jgi:hypothetical protein